MIKFGTNPVPRTYPTPSHKEVESIHRLIVLVPANINFRAAMQRISELAHTAGMHIQLLGLCKDKTEESRLRRELITMASLLQDGQVCAEAKVEIGTNWVEALKTSYEAGDMIVCFAEQQTGILRRPLSQILETNFNATVYILSDPAPQKSNSNRLSQIGIWVGLIAVVVGFGVLQVQIVHVSAGWLQNILLIFSIIPELWLIWVWDSRFG